MMKLLLKYKAEPNGQTTTTWDTPIYCAVYLGHFNAVKLLLEHNADPDGFDKTGYSPLSYAVEDGNFNIAQLLLENGAKPTPPVTGRRIPLVEAVEKNNLEMTKLLLKYGSDINARDNREMQALTACCKTEKSAINKIFVLLIVQKLIFALSIILVMVEPFWKKQYIKIDTSIVKVLIKHGADPNLHGAICSLETIHL